jgi:hypothetical protein
VVPGDPTYPYTDHTNVRGHDLNLTKILFSINEDFACTVFKSCEKVSLVAAASIQSSLSFMDFLGINGEETSLSVITF